jgi:hypothetical protein
MTRPDLAYAVHLVSQFMTAPRSVQYAVVLRILRYVKGTLFHGLHSFSHSSLDLRVYSDVDWAGDPTDRHSTTGYCFLLGDSLTHGVVRNNLLLPVLALKLSIVLLLTPPLSSSGSVGFSMIWVFLRPLVLVSFVTINVRFRLRIMIYFMNVLNILRSTFILCAIIFCKELSIFVLLLPLIN